MIRTHVCQALIVVVCLANSPPLPAADPLAQALKEPILREGEAKTQHDMFVLARIPELIRPATARAWQQQSTSIRNQVFAEVVFRGVDRSWYSGKPQVVWGDRIATEHGYAIRKLRYEALPGLWIPALLYEPDKLQGKVPAILDVNGHAATGKVTDYKQLICINQAKRGMLAMNLEWIGMGQLRDAGYAHNHLALLDLCGCNGVSVFYLAMSRGLDVLLDHPHADLERAVVTGLSGGGWQTIILSSLDTRVKLAVPVAGHSSLRQRLGHRGSVGDLEQNPTDLISVADYAHLTALMAPRPTLLIYNAKDDCCFVAKTVRPNTFDPVVPFYEQAGAADAFEFYENLEPGTHNYDLDNRQQFYRFVNRHFLRGAQTNDKEIPSKDELQSAEALHIELPQPNATFHSLATDRARELPRKEAATPPVQRRERLKRLLRFPSLTGKLEPVGEVSRVEDKTISRYRLQAGREWVLPTVVVSGEKTSRTVLLLADKGIAAQADLIVSLVADEARVVSLDPVLIGQADPGAGLAQNAMLMSTVGERPLGIQAAQTLSAVEQFRQLLSVDKLDIRAVGPRSGMIALCAAALAGPDRFGKLALDGLPDSLKAFLEPSASYNNTPEVYCFGLLEWFDRPQLEQLVREK